MPFIFGRCKKWGIKAAISIIKVYVQGFAQPGLAGNWVKNTTLLVHILARADICAKDKIALNHYHPRVVKFAHRHFINALHAFACPWHILAGPG